MVQGLESSNIFTPQEMHQKVLMQKLVSYDKDNKAGLSKAELNKYLAENGEMNEFAKKLVEKFEQVDQNKDGQVSTQEMNSLQNNRGLWAVNPMGAASMASATTAASQQQSLIGANSTDLLSKNIQSLVKKGTTIANNNPDLLTKLEGVVHKII